MPSIAESVASLRISGDALNPESVTARIGAMPTTSYRKGDVEQVREGTQLVRRTGLWLLEAPARKPEDLNSQVAEILARLTQDIDVWKALTREFEVDLYCGLFMASTNDWLSLSASTLAALGERGIELGRVEPGESTATPLHGPRLHVNEPVSSRERVLQVV